jgi:hypothetical protein
MTHNERTSRAQANATDGGLQRTRYGKMLQRNEILLTTPNKGKTGNGILPGSGEGVAPLTLSFFHTMPVFALRESEFRNQTY